LKRVWKVIAIAGLLGIAIWLFRVLFPGDEKLIRKLLAEAAEAAAVKPNENPIFKLAGANKFVAYFSPDAVLKVDVPGVDIRSLSGRDDLLQAITGARATLQEARFALHQVHVKVDSDGQSAGAQFVATAYINGGADPIVQELKLQFRKIDGRWQIVRAETVKTLGM